MDEKLEIPDKLLNIIRRISMNIWKLIKVCPCWAFIFNQNETIFSESKIKPCMFRSFICGYFRHKLFN